MTEPTKHQSRLRQYAKRFGVGAFLFFLIKGLLWLIVPAVLIWWGIEIDW